MMDSTTITLFDNILKGVGRHPKHGKKKGGMKVHTVMKYQVGVPMVVELTSAAKHDHYLLKKVHSFSQIVTMLRLTLMYYTNFIAFMEDPQKDESAIYAERAKSPPPEPSLFD